MSENNGHSGAQWTKAVAAAAAAAAHSQHVPHLHLYDQQQHSAGGGLAPPHSPLYGVGGTIHHPHAENIGLVASYATARFQAPPIHNTSSHVAPATVLTPLVVGSSSTASNVPAPSGFVPPPFPSAAATAAGPATSGLNPNPFVVASGSNVGAGGAGSAVGRFGLEQFQHLNPQQQFELSKLMNAMNSVTAASLATNTASGTGPMPLATNSVTQPQPQILHPPPIRHHGPPAAAAASASDLASSSGVITTTIAENVLSVISNSGTNSSATATTPFHHGRLLGMGVKVPDDDKMRRIQNVVESGIGDHAKQQILQILDRISTLKPVEKLLLYLRLPGEAPETDPLRHPQNPLGTRSEINHTINWVRSHLEHDPQVSIPKQDVYNDYIAYCERLDIKPLSTADFGKVMKQVFPGIRPRRLGTRGHSRYCYAAMRKTTQLPAPQLPLLSNTQMASTTPAGSEDCSQPTGSGGPSINEADPATWDIIKTWAESLLNVKVENAKDLAERIKTNNALGASVTATQTRTNATQKKYAQREPKEKRSLADMGPLKKRRKKKRKGSSSSESSCNQQQKPALLLPQTNNNNSNNNNDLSPTTSGYAANSSLGVPSEDEQKSIKMIEVKQEFIESPNFQNVQQHMPNIPPMQAGTMGESYMHQHQPQQQQQMMPMNLATEQRTVLTKAPPSAAAASSAFQRSSLSAVKNLTPKIMEISTTSPIHRTTNNAAAISPSSGSGGGSGAECQMPIKEEFIDEYNPTTILCKKVRKAQQTKGFWINSPTTPSPMIPTITTTAASPPATAPTVIATAGTAAAATAVSPVSSYHLMGPPAQITNNTSTSPSTSLQDGTSPKVASRNMQQLRAKKQQHSSDSTPGDIDKDADLPENLGLPRERVISICNMDKHELDHYFLPGEEENSEDQDTELLQYFQTGDAEEKLNSLDAAKHHRNPTAANTATTTQMPPTAISNERQARLDGNMQSQQQQTLLRHDLSLKNNNNNNKEIHANDRRTTFANEVSRVLDGSSNSSFATAAAQLVATKGGTSSPAAAAVGVSASASLTLMSQKHQQKQQQNQQQQPPPQSQKMNTNKRKINLHTTSSIPNYMTDMGSTRKNFIFLPISPNINSTTIAPIGSGGTATSSSGPVGFFASPGLSARSRPKIALSKQQSLDNDSSDPMIGASRRRHSYVSAMSTSNTSASAPPSPSVLHQQQQQQQQQQMYNQQYGNYSTLQWIDPPISGSGASGYNNMTAAANTAALLNEQNSLDLDIFGAAAAAAASSVNSNYVQNALDGDEDDDCPLTPLTETQRSQSVPLSQLQRIHSPAFNRGGSNQNNFQSLNHHQHYSSNCASVRQTPVPPEFAGDSTTLFSENSCSQHSIGGAGTGVGGGCNNNPTSSAVADAIKLEEAVVLASDSTALLDDVDVSEILSSPDFVAKFSSIAQSNSAATTTCSSAGSSSGYSSGACTTFGSSMVGSMGMGGGIVSRSVPSTPLPHHQQNLFGNSHFYNRRRGGGANDEIYLSPTAAGPAGTGSSGTSSSFTLAMGGRHNKYTGNSTHNSARSSYDISKSMPTTPITTPCFRYSPTEFNRDFLINGNTIDSINSSFGAVGSENLISAGDSIGLVNLNSDSLIDDGAEGSSVADAFVIGSGNDGESIIVGSDILGNL